MRALILAAGRGSRMGEKTADRPKCLLEVGGKTLIEHQLEALADCGIGPVAIVVGYCADEIREVVGFRAEYIENTIWRRTNSLYSFWLASDWVDGPVLVLNSDLLLDPKIIEMVHKVEGDALAFDSGSGDGAEQMKLEVRDGLLISMSKTLPDEVVAGENVGVLKFEEGTARRLLKMAGRIVEEGGQNDWLSSAVSRITEERPLRAVDIAGFPWGEIDFPFDLDRARKQVWPAIRANARGRQWPRRLGRALGGAAAAVAFLVMTNLLWASNHRAEWETLEIFGLEAVRVVSESREERWWQLGDDQSATLRFGGPTRLRVESRMVRPSETPVRYAVEASLDGVPFKWKDRVARPSKRWRAFDQPLGKRHGFEIDVPDGTHTVSLRLVGPDGQSCLVRVAEAVTDRDSEE